jgi:putative ABC transport system permease protein
MNFTTLAARNVLRNKGRTIWTMAGVIIALLTFILLRTVLTSWDDATSYGAQDRIATRNKISFVVPLPLNYVEKIKNVPGVTQITWMNWFGAKDPKNEADFFASLAVDQKTVLDVYNDFTVPPEQVAAWKADRSGALIGKALSKKKGWKLGDTVTLRGTIFPGDWKFTVRAIYDGTKKGTDVSQFFFHWDYMNEAFPPGSARRDQVGWIISRVGNAGDGPAVSVAIDKLFEDTDNPSFTQSETAMNQSFLGMFGAILRALNIVSMVILVIMTLILGNTVAMGVRERTREYGTLRALGFLPRHLAMFVLAEAGFIGALGGVLGVGIGTLLVNAFGKVLEENLPGIFPSFQVRDTTAIAAFLLAIGLSVLASGLPALQAARLKVIDALRQVG